MKFSATVDLLGWMLMMLSSLPLRSRSVVVAWSTKVTPMFPPLSRHYIVGGWRKKRIKDFRSSRLLGCGCASRTRWLSTASALGAGSVRWQPGETVRIVPVAAEVQGTIIDKDNDDKDNDGTLDHHRSSQLQPPPILGVVREHRGSGWYSVEPFADAREDGVSLSSSSSSSSSSEQPTPALLKIRGTRLQRWTTTTTTEGGSAGGRISKPSVSDGPPSSSSDDRIEDTASAVAVINDDAASVFQAFPPAQMATSDSQPVPPPPTMIDLDAVLDDSDTPFSSSSSSSRESEQHNDASYLWQVSYFRSAVSRWVVFTDLHCCPATLDTCLQVLEFVHEQAVQRSAGVLFLGDWWHHRGTLRVDCLNAVLAQLNRWTVPCIMIPGNHDQVTLAGHCHGLTPLENAYRVAAPSPPTTAAAAVDSSVPGVLVFSHPTKFGNALFVPHIRSNAVMESVLRSDVAAASEAIFCHADVEGAHMNDLILSETGVPPDAFPANRPVYSGHFHKPHKVQRQRRRSSSSSVEYLGSPYQVSLSEAHQVKALAVVDSRKRWECVERIPIEIGRKHFRSTSLSEFLELRPAAAAEADLATAGDNGGRGKVESLKAGDRVVLTMEKEELDGLRRDVGLSSTVGVGGDAGAHDRSPLDDHLELLRKAGALVEIREVRPVPVVSSSTSTGQEGPSSSLLLREDLSLSSTWKAYLEDQVQRRALSSATAERLLEAGQDLIEEVQANDTEFARAATISQNVTHLELRSVSVEGFGPFHEPVTYPLCDRGLVLLRGTNHDGGSSESNGSGKSSLAMSALWALTGSLDPRPLQDSKVSDVINDSSKTSRVCVTGSINGVDFSISRTKTLSGRGSSLVFLFGGRDLTAQSVKETQLVIEEKLGVNPQVLARTVFHGQHGLNGLLEATDARLKEELSLVVPLSAWQEASAVVRKRARSATREASQLEGMLTVRTEDLDMLRQRLDHVRSDHNVKEKTFQESQVRFEAEIARVCGDSNGSQEDHPANDTSLVALEEHLLDADRSVEEAEGEQQDLLRKRDAELETLQGSVLEQTALVSTLRDQLQSLDREYDASSLKVAMARERVEGLEETWGIDLSSGMPDSFVLPGNCPTCHQPLSGAAVVEDDSAPQHPTVLLEVEDEVSRALLLLRESRSNLTSVEECRDAARMSITEEEDRLAEVRGNLDERVHHWTARVDESNEKLRATRAAKERANERLAMTAKQVQRSALADQLTASISLERESLRQSQQAVEAAREEMSECEKRIRKLQSEIQEKEKMSQLMTELSEAFGPRGVQTFVLQNIVDLWQSTTQSYLDGLSDGAQRLELTLDAGDRILRRAFLRGGGVDTTSRSGEYRERPLASLSGGQWRRCSLALDLGFAEMVARRGHLRPSLCVLDEPLTHLDRSGRSEVGRILRSLLRGNGGGVDPSSGLRRLPVMGSGLNPSTVLVILQDLAAEELEEAFDRIDEVVRRNGKSSVLVDEGAG